MRNPLARGCLSPVLTEATREKQASTWRLTGVRERSGLSTFSEGLWSPGQEGHRKGPRTSSRSSVGGASSPTGCPAPAGGIREGPGGSQSASACQRTPSRCPHRHPRGTRTACKEMLLVLQPCQGGAEAPPALGTKAPALLPQCGAGDQATQTPGPRGPFLPQPFCSVPSMLRGTMAASTFLSSYGCPAQKQGCLPLPPLPVCPPEFCPPPGLGTGG